MNKGPKVRVPGVVVVVVFAKHWKSGVKCLLPCIDGMDVLQGSVCVAGGPVHL